MSKKIQLTFLILIFALVGCKTNGVNKADQSAREMRNSFDALKSLPDRITAMTNSLDEIVKEGGDMRAEFKAFEKNINKLISDRNQLDRLIAKVDSCRDTFTKAWAVRKDAIKNDEMRTRAEKRYDEVIAEVDKLKVMAVEADAKFDLWMQDVLDIRTYLESDLNASGIASVADLAAQISLDAEPVKEKIALLLAEINALSDAITPTTDPSES